MNKKDFNKAVKRLKEIVPYTDFVYNAERGTVRKVGRGGSDDDFIEISVKTLFDIVLQNES